MNTNAKMHRYITFEKHLYVFNNNLKVWLLQCFWWPGRAMAPGSFQCWGVLLIRTTVGHWPTVLEAVAGRSCLDVSSLFFLPRLKNCIKGL